MPSNSRRTGEETRAEAIRIALDLFIIKGYEATSLREIADRLGISKASLYYHFASKEHIVAAGLGGRADEAAELLAWLEQQPDSPDLLARTVTRWVDSLSVDKLRGIRFVNANPGLLQRLAGAEEGARIGDTLSEVARRLAGDDAQRLVLVRMALLSINAAVAAARGSDLDDDAIVAGARSAATALVTALG